MNNLATNISNNVEALKAKRFELMNEMFDAIEHDDVETITKLICNGLDINGRGRDGQTALHVAARNNNIFIVDLLIGLGANPNLEDIDEVSPFHESIINGHLECIKTLRKAGGEI